MDQPDGDLFGKRYLANDAGDQVTMRDVGGGCCSSFLHGTLYDRFQMAVHGRVKLEPRPVAIDSMGVMYATLMNRGSRNFYRL